MVDYHTFNKDMPVEEILKRMDANGGNVQIIHAGPCFLQFKLHQELINEQNKMHVELMKEQRDFQSKNLRITQRLVIGTWALVLATLLLAFK